MRSTPYNVHVLSRSGWAMRFTTRLRLAPAGQCIIGLVSDSDRTHYAVGSSPGVTERSDGIPRVGEIVAGKYRVDRIVGIGGMGVVLAVTHQQLHEPYAIKFLLPRAAANAETVARFVREARAAVRIKSEHIARVSDVGETPEGMPFIVMELLEGSDLGEVLASRGPLAVGDAVEYVLQACEGIAEAHALGIIHRDLKPANLFLTQRSDGVPFVKVLDFGISKAASDLHASPTLTDTDSVFGSPAYMSPEQIRSAKNVDARTDVWALGVILHELLTGRLPFDGETSGAILSAIAADPPAKLRAQRPDLPEELEAIVLRCLAKSVGDRFANISELARALDPFKLAGGIASIGRIQRLTNPPPKVPPAKSEQAPPRSPSVANVATDAPVTRMVAQPSRSRTRLVVAVASALVAIGVGAGVLGYSALSHRGGATSAAAEAPPSVPAPSMAASSSMVVPSSTVAIAAAPPATASSPAPRASVSGGPSRSKRPVNPSAAAPHSTEAVVPAGPAPAATATATASGLPISESSQ